MVESDPNVELKIETMNPAEFGNHLAARQSAVAALPLGLENYHSKKLMLEQSILMEKNISEHIRAVSAMTVQNGAVDPNLTLERKTAMLVRLRQDLFTARAHFLYVKSK